MLNLMTLTLPLNVYQIVLAPVYRLLSTVYSFNPYRLIASSKMRLTSSS